jgi:putative ABC transport system ATP-binding protein
MSERGGGIDVVDVTKVYERHMPAALDHLDLTIQPSEFVAITGPSGCGKSTLLHLIAGLDRPSSGTVRVNGEDIQRVNADRFRRRQIGLVFQLHNLLTHLTAEQNVAIPMFGTGRSTRECAQRSRELLADVQLGDRAGRRPPELSGGERQRIAIARALANEPSILLADEPTGSLDSASVERVLDLLRRLRADRGLTIVLVTHDLNVAAAADRLVRMADGHVISE